MRHGNLRALGVYSISSDGLKVWKRAYEEMNRVADAIVRESQGGMQKAEIHKTIGTEVKGFHIIVDGVVVAIPENGNHFYDLWTHLLEQDNFLDVWNRYPALRRLLWLIQATRPNAMYVAYKTSLGQVLLTPLPPDVWALQHRDTMDRVYGPPDANLSAPPRRSSLLLDQINLLGGWKELRH
jgi:hypothetical protein